jgi:RecA-family ATPase
LLPDGLALFVGSPKQKKSLTSIHVALALCYGGRVFGSLQVEKADVLIMALEDNERRLKVRLGDITGLRSVNWSP